MVTITDYRGHNYYKSQLINNSFQFTKAVWINSDYFTSFPIGNVPLVAGPVTTEKIDYEKREAVVRLNERGLSEVIVSLLSTIEAPYLIKSMERTELGTKSYSVRFRRYRTYDYYMVPHFISISVPLSHLNITIRHRQILVNPPLTHDQFKIPPPDTFYELDELP